MCTCMLSLQDRDGGRSSSTHTDYRSRGPDKEREVEAAEAAAETHKGAKTEEKQPKSERANERAISPEQAL